MLLSKAIYSSSRGPLFKVQLQENETLKLFVDSSLDSHFHHKTAGPNDTIASWQMVINCNVLRLSIRVSMIQHYERMNHFELFAE